MKAGVDKLDINKLVNVPTNLSNLKIKLDDLDVGKFKTVTVNDAADKQVVKNIKFNTMKAKVNNLEKKIPDETTLVHINQFNTGKQRLKKKMEMLIKKIPGIFVWNIKIDKVESKIPNVTDLVKKTDYDAKIL